MRCDVLLFAQLAEAVGTDRLAIELPEGATVGDALARLAETHAPIAAAVEGIAVAVDERYCRESEVLRAGQTIALIPPVSGG